MAPGSGGGSGGSGGNSTSFEKELENAAKFNSSLLTRMRRTTKFKIEGNCKNPPKKHKDEEYVDD